MLFLSARNKYCGMYWDESIHTLFSAPRNPQHWVDLCFFFLPKFWWHLFLCLSFKTEGYPLVGNDKGMEIRIIQAIVYSTICSRKTLEIIQMSVSRGLVEQNSETSSGWILCDTIEDIKKDIYIYIHGMIYRIYC